MRKIYLIIPIKCSCERETHNTTECSGWEPDLDADGVIAYGSLKSCQYYLKDNKIPENTVVIHDVDFIKEFF